MNKQELIKGLNWLRDACAKEGGFTSGVRIGLTLAIGEIEKLDEPEKIVIPKFVAEAFEKAREDNCFASQLINAMYDSSDEVGYWLEVPSNEKLLLRAWLDGYEIEKEKLYYVIDKSKIPILTIHEGKVVASVSVSKVERAEKLSTTDFKYRLTEKQIKDYDGRYWSFAVEVEE